MITPSTEINAQPLSQKLETDILALQNVCFSHAGSLNAAISDISIKVHQGEILSLLGPSGCGKTTLLRLIAGLEKLDQGEISLGKDILSTPTYHLRPEKRPIGLVFQDFALFPHLTVADNIGFGLPHLSKKDQNTEIYYWLSKVHLSDKAENYPHELSGGQQQRVALARALARRPDLLLLDEPFSSLDAVLRDQMRRDLLRLLKQENITSIIVTHDPKEALSISDRIAVMNKGYICQIDTPSKLYWRPKSQFVGEFIGDLNIVLSKHVADYAQNFQPPQTQTSTEQSGYYAIRPELLKVDFQAPANAKVIFCDFIGGSAQLHLQSLQDTTVIWKATCPSYSIPQIGSLVHVSYQAEDLIWFAQTET